MQKAYLVSNKDTAVAEFLARRSIMEVVEERRSLSDVDLDHLGIIDVNKFLYIYYGSDDGGLSFRTDLNIMRQLLRSAFFHADSAMFILVNNNDPLLEDLILAACRDTTFQGSNLDIIHHSGALVLNNVAEYLTGDVFGDVVKSTYRSVYIREADSEERNRYAESSDTLERVMPMLTDQWGMYKRRAAVESLSSSMIYSELLQKPQIFDDFPTQLRDSDKGMTSVVLSGDRYTKFGVGAEYLVQYFSRVGVRVFIIDMTGIKSNHVDSAYSKQVSIVDIQSQMGFEEMSAKLKCNVSQLGYVMEMLENVRGVGVYVFVCDRNDFAKVSEFVGMISTRNFKCFTTHFCEEALTDLISGVLDVNTVFLSTDGIYREFDITKYRENFDGIRVARFESSGIDATAFYESIFGTDNAILGEIGVTAGV